MTLTLEQKIARKEVELQRLKQKKDKLLTRQKIIVGAVMIDQSFGSVTNAQVLIELLEEHVTRKSDQTAIEPLLSDLRAYVESELNDH